MNDENKLIAERRAKLAELRSQGSAFPNDFRPNVCAAELRRAFSGQDTDELAEHEELYRVAGRMLGSPGERPEWMRDSLAFVKRHGVEYPVFLLFQPVAGADV